MRVREHLPAWPDRGFIGSLGAGGIFFAPSLPLSSNLRLNGLQPIGTGAASVDFLTNSGLANHTDRYPHTSSASLTLPDSLGVNNAGVVCSGSSGSSFDPRHFFMDHIYPPSTTVSGNSNGGSGGSGDGDGDGNNNSGNFRAVTSVSPTSTVNFPYDSAFHSLSVSLGLKSLIPLVQ
nr:unnamed protein product [Spirometra erinaceieuropaei]